MCLDTILNGHVEGPVGRRTPLFSKNFLNVEKLQQYLDLKVRVNNRLHNLTSNGIWVRGAVADGEYVPSLLSSKETHVFIRIWRSESGVLHQL